MFFRKVLVRIRREYNTNTGKLFLYSGLGTLVALIVGCLLDFLLPFDGAWNIIRSIWLIPSAAVIFVFGYTLSLFMHYKQVANNENWVPFRMRMSPAWRIRLSVIIGAFMLVFVYANGFNVGYTFISSTFVAIGIGLFAFMRTTQAEQARQEFDIPDVRDIKYDQKLKELTTEREKRKELSRKEKRDEAERKKARERKERKNQLKKAIGNSSKSEDADNDEIDSENV